jgi:DNA-directed RNA polymerase specialized sigma24 family protein
MVQESFVQPWRTAGQFNAGRGSVGAYLTVIARSAAADIRKRPSSRPLLADEEVALPPAGDNIDQILDGLVVDEATS